MLGTKILQRRKLGLNATLSGFCLQYRIADLVFSQPPIINSYMVSFSAGTLDKHTWQLLGPRKSISRDPATTGPNLYSNLSSVSKGAPSAWTNDQFGVAVGTFCFLKSWSFEDLPSIFQVPVAPHPVQTPTNATGNGSGSVQEMKGMASPSRPAEMMPLSHRTQKPRNSDPLKMPGVSISTTSGFVLFFLMTLFALLQPPMKIWNALYKPFNMCIY